jgi:RNA polymerase primary sigma factor
MTRAVRGRTIPYGTLVGASAELKQAYYAHGYLHDEDMPELPCVPLEGECVDPGEELFKKEMIDVVQEVLNDVPARERKVVCLRFGIGLTQEYTLDEIGVMLNLSGNRIRQIEGTALRYMKHPSRWDKLIGLMERNK